MESTPKEEPKKLRTITKEEINKLPLTRYEGPIHVIRSEGDARKAVKVLQKERVLGFDTETRPSFRKGESHPPALIQLATDDRVYIFQLKKVGFPKALRMILSDPKVLKVGVALAYDVKKLQELKDFKPAGFVDLGTATDKLNIQNNGLRGLAALLLGVRISKSAQRSNWSRSQLTSTQINYAATDAWVSRELYLRIRDLKKEAKKKAHHDGQNRDTDDV